MKGKKNKSMNEVSKGYEAFIAKKKTNSNAADLFEKVLKKAVKPKQRALK